MAKNWIADAIKHKGALHKELGVPMGKKIPSKKLEKAAKSKGVEGKRARLARTIKSFNKKDRYICHCLKGKVKKILDKISRQK